MPRIYNRCLVPVIFYVKFFSTSAGFLVIAGFLFSWRGKIRVRRCPRVHVEDQRRSGIVTLHFCFICFILELGLSVPLLDYLC